MGWQLAILFESDNKWDNTLLSSRIVVSLLGLPPRWLKAHNGASEKSVLREKMSVAHGPKLIAVADSPFMACVPICLFPLFLENRLEGES